MGPAAVARLRRLCYEYPGSADRALTDLDLDLGAGLTLVTGASGSGKSTFLRVLNGLVPHFHGGRWSGAAAVGDLDVARTPTSRLARRVGFVFQDPELQAVYETVERDVAFGLENTGATPAVMADRVDAAIHAAGIEGLRGRRVSTLSGGERQRLAIAGALALEPDILALDEPTSQLDPTGSAAVIAACERLARSGHAVVVAEHRLERLLPVAGSVIRVAGGRAAQLEPRLAAAGLESPPAVVDLGRRLGWQPLPLSVEEARPLIPALDPIRAGTAPSAGGDGWELRGATAGAGSEPAFEAVDLAGGGGEVVVLMGPNGSGKTTLLRVLAGLVPLRSGSRHCPPGRVAYLPQNPTALLHQASVRAEVELTLRWRGAAGRADVVLAQLGLTALAGRYPRDLSSGEQQRAALAAVLAGDPATVLLDEPTRGMDLAARRALGRLIAGLRERGAAIVIATHDSDLAAEVGDRIVLLGAGHTIELGHPEAALSGGSALATQIGRLYPGGPVTVAGVLRRLGLDSIR